MAWLTHGVRVFAVVLCGLIAGAVLAGQPVAPAAAAPPKPAEVVTERLPALRVGILSFNIRYGTAKDGENAWPKRREQVFEIIKDPRIEIFGLQEALRFQLDEIKAACSGLGEIGVGREDGKTKGEYAAILYRTDNWKPTKSGTFWLSETPEVPNSMSWKTACTRVCTWARFERVGCPEDGRPCVLWVFNTHMDHVSAEARSKGARLIAKRIAERGDDAPFVLTGDFNSDEKEEAARYFTAAPSEGDDKSPLGTLADTFRVLHAGEKEVATFNEFKAEAKVGKKIDYVLVKPGVKVVESWIDRRSKDGRAPSDHYPVGAIVEFASETRPG